MKVKSTQTKVYPRIDTRTLKSWDILAFDSDNKYPQRINDIVNDSGTAVSCLRTYEKFVVGRGFVNEDFMKTKVNRDGMTVAQLLSKIVRSYGRHKGVTIHFNYNAHGQKSEIQFLPFEYARITNPKGDHRNMIAIYDDWGEQKKKKVDKKKIQYINKYSPTDVLEQVASIDIKDADKLSDMELVQAKFSQYKGQILYWTPDGNDEYTLCPFDAVLEDMQTEAQTKKFKHSTASKNFLASHILVTGEEDSAEDDDGTDFGKQLELFQGGEGAGTMLWMQRANPDDKIDLERVDIQNYDGLYAYTEDSARASIRRIFDIPAVFLEEGNNGIGESKELSDATKYYNNVTSVDRDVISQLFEEIFAGSIYAPEDKDYSIIPIQYSDIAAFSFDSSTLQQINGVISSDMSLSQKRGTLKVMYGFSEEQLDEMVGRTGATNDTVALATVFGVGGTTKLVEILSSETLSTEQKKGTLSVLFGLTEEQIDKMLAEEPTNPNVQG